MCTLNTMLVNILNCMNIRDVQSYRPDITIIMYLYDKNSGRVSTETHQSVGHGRLHLRARVQDPHGIDRRRDPCLMNQTVAV